MGKKGHAPSQHVTNSDDDDDDGDDDDDEEEEEEADGDGDGGRGRSELISVAGDIFCEISTIKYRTFFFSSLLSMSFLLSYFLTFF